MDGIRIFVHAVRMVLGNLETALRIAGALLIVQLALTLMAGDGYFMSEPMQQPMMYGMQGSFLAFVLGVLQILFGLWIAVAWHRFILLEETPGAYLPAWNGVAIWAYFKAGVLLAFVVIIAVIPMMLIAGLVLFPFVAVNPAEPSLFVGLLGFLIMYLPAAYFAYRLSPILPSAAIGEKIGLKDAWVETSPSGMSFVALTVVSVVAGWLIFLPAMLLAGHVLTLALIWSAVAQWLTVLVGASILTTIYGHYVQKRDLNA
jgi:hypothetical protein